MSPIGWIGFTLASGIGAAMRFGVDDAVRRRLGADSPWGILAVNVAGCAGLGVVVGLRLYHGLGADITTVVGTAGLGAFTTFSTVVVETVRMAQTGAAERAAANLAATVAVGLVAAAGGLGITALW